MPTVPMMNPAGSVQATELSAPSAGLSAYESSAERSANARAATGRALTETGGQLTAIAADQMATANEAAVNNLDATLTGHITSILHDPQNGYLNKSASDAMAGRQPALDDLDKVITTMTDNIASPRQAAMFRELAERRRVAAQDAIDTHAGQQTKAYTTQGLLDRADESMNAAILSYDAANPNNAQHALNVATYMASLDDLARNNGITGDQREAFLQKGRANMVGGLIKHLIATEQLSQANDLLTKYKADGTLTANDVDTFTHTLSVGNDKTAALKLALDLSSQHASLAGQEKALDELFKADKINENVHALAVSQLRARDSDRRTQESDADKSVMGRVFDFARKNPGATLADLPTDDLAYVTRRGLGPNAQAIFTYRDGAVEDSSLYVSLLHKAADDPSGFYGTDIVKLRGMLTEGHFNQLAGMQASVGKANALQLQGTKVMSQAIKDTRADLLASGLNLSPKPDTEPARQLARFEGRLADALTAAQEAKGNIPLTPAEAKDITRGLVRDQTLSGTGWDLPLLGRTLATQNKPWAMSDEEVAKDWDIPAAERASITSALEARGKPVTEENIQRTYKASQGIYR